MTHTPATEVKQEANARLIVRAVNNVDALAEAVREFVTDYDSNRAMTKGERDARVERARAALRAWEPAR